jgi:hypothetical protein
MSATPAQARLDRAYWPRQGRPIGDSKTLGQMGMQKIDHARVTEVPLDNSHYGWLPISTK